MATAGAGHGAPPLFLWFFGDFRDWLTCDFDPPRPRTAELRITRITANQERRERELSASPWFLLDADAENAGDVSRPTRNHSLSFG